LVHCSIAIRSSSAIRETDRQSGKIESLPRINLTAFWSGRAAVPMSRERLKRLGIAMSIECATAAADYNPAQRAESVQGDWTSTYRASERSFSEAGLLLREFSHRINNEFAAAIGFVSVAAARSADADVKTALGAVQNLLHNYARVHHALQMPEHDIRIDAAAYLRQLCRAISGSKLDGKGIELLLVERRFLMSSERCWRLGLIVSELITNSVRHAFNDGGGSIRVELRPTASFVECRVTDSGKSEANVSPGRGLKIIEDLVDSLDGTIEQKFGPRGAVSVVVIPLRA
jgi:two-component sensor histidine kinase